ncbi:MAG: hypothetical protein DMF09_08625 [Verrucomicrobia bacterium]|nr:MAG: hypothetical protein DMF09_08625 [Verrucomicrobiota bacterium]
MKTLSLITAGFFLVFGTVASNGAAVTRISNETGVPVATLQSERASTGLGWGELENAHLLANGLAANGSSLTFNDLVAMHQAGEGWGKIERDNGLNFGRLVKYSDCPRQKQQYSWPDHSYSEYSSHEQCCFWPKPRGHAGA